MSILSRVTLVALSALSLSLASCGGSDGPPLTQAQLDSIKKHDDSVAAARAEEAAKEAAKDSARKAEFEHRMKTDRKFKDSVEKARKEALERAGMGVSFDRASTGFGLDWDNLKDVKDGKMWTGEGVGIIFGGDRYDLKKVALLLGRFTENPREKGVVLRSLLNNCLSESAAQSIANDIKVILDAGRGSESWTVGTNKRVEFTFEPRGAILTIEKR